MSSVPPRPPRAPLPLQGRIYVIRVIFTVMALIMLVIQDLACGFSPLRHVAIITIGLSYPHLAHLLFGRFDPQHRHGHWAFLLDGAFVGGVIGALGFALEPSALLLAINLFNWTVIGRLRLVLAGLLASAIGALLSYWPENQQATCFSSPELTSLILIAYLVIVARLIRHLLESLRRQQRQLYKTSEAALADKVCAERALLAVLPPSLANDVVLHGFVAARRHEDTVVLYLEPCHESFLFSLGELEEIYTLCETIFSRYGIEIVKSFQGRILAFTIGQDGAERVIRAYAELDERLQAKAKVPSSQKPIRMHAYAHHGVIELGFARQERLNAELAGPAVAELFSFVLRTSRPHPGEMFATPAFVSRLPEQTSRCVSEAALDQEGRPFFRLRFDDVRAAP